MKTISLKQVNQVKPCFVAQSHLNGKIALGFFCRLLTAEKQNQVSPWFIHVQTRPNFPFPWLPVHPFYHPVCIRACPCLSLWTGTVTVHLTCQHFPPNFHSRGSAHYRCSQHPPRPQRQKSYCIPARLWCTKAGKHRCHAFGNLVPWSFAICTAPCHFSTGICHEARGKPKKECKQETSLATEPVESLVLKRRARNTSCHSELVATHATRNLLAGFVALLQRYGLSETVPAFVNHHQQVSSAFTGAAFTDKPVNHLRWDQVAHTSNRQSKVTVPTLLHNKHCNM